MECRLDKFPACIPKGDRVPILKFSTRVYSIDKPALPRLEAVAGFLHFKLLARQL